MSEPMTLREIADLEGVSHQRIAEILSTALGKIRRGLYERGITDYSMISIDEVMRVGFRSGKRPAQ